MTLNIRTINDTGVIVKAIATCKDNNQHQVIIPRGHYRASVLGFYRLGVKDIEELDYLLLQYYQNVINQKHNGFRTAVLNIN